MITPTPKLNLRLPRSWNECTTEELETIAGVMMDCAQRVTVYHPSSMFDLKVALFFALSGVTIMEPINPRVKVEEQYYVCTHKDFKEPFNLYLWQILYWVEGETDYDHPVKDPETGEVTYNKKRIGMLDWLDDGKSGLLLFPYDSVRRSRYAIVNTLHLTRFFGTEFHGPSALMDGFSWQQYRFAHDYMSYFLDQQNVLLKMQKRRKVLPEKELLAQARVVDTARAMFLATIFTRRVSTIDVATGKTIKDYAYTSNQHTDNAQYFRGFSDVQWQCVLFWWTGMMHWLQKQYPHCFKKSAVKEQSATPLELYTRTTATMEKYLGLDEDKVNRQSFHLVFQHMEDMAKENEELEKIRRKK